MATMLNIKDDGMKESLNSFLLALFYGTTSVAIIMFNKTVFSIFEFHFSNTLTLGQMITALIFLMVMKQLNYIQFPSFEYGIALKLLPLSLFFNGMVLTGLGALMFLNVPMYSALRRFTTFIVMVFEVALLNKKPKTSHAVAVVVMVAGAIIASLTDLTFNLKGYILVFLNCIVTAFYLIYIEKAKKEVDIGPFGLMFYNNILSVPVVIVIVLFLEAKDVVVWPGLYDIAFLISFLCSCVLAFLLNYSIFICTMYNSPLATSVTGQIKNIVCDVLGLFLFGDVILYVWNILGLCIGATASIVYSFLKYRQIQEKNKGPIIIDRVVDDYEDKLEDDDDEEEMVVNDEEIDENHNF